VQNPAVKLQLDSALKEAEFLVNLLECALRDYTRGSLARRMYNAAKGEKENDIVTSFKRLEQDKSSLIICVVLANTATLTSLQGDLTRLVRKGNEERDKNLAISVMSNYRISVSIKTIAFSVDLPSC